MKQERIRSEVEEQAKWNLKAMYQNEEAVNKDIEQLKQYHKDLLSFKGKIMESSETLKKFYQVYINYDKVLSNLYTYSHMLCDEDTTDSNHQAFKMKIDKLVEDLGAELSFISPEMMATSYDEVLKMIEQDTSLKEYQFDLEKSFRYQDHVLSTREEELIAKASNAMGTGDEVFYNLDNSDIHLRPIHDEQGNLVELNNSNYNKYMNSKNREVRKEAFDSMYEYWKNLKNTVAATYKGQIKEDFFSSEMRKFDSPLKESLYSDNIDISVYECLIQTVHKNLDKMYQYVDLRKQILGVDELHMYDVYVDLCEEEAKSIPFEEGKQIVFDALKPLGETYLKDLNKAFEERWIDIYPNTGKKSGAYSWGTYDSYPYLLLNYNDTVDSVSTMAHELGHSMHSYYSNQNQEYLYHNYPIFLAEIASTVNEILLNDYLYKNAQSKSEKMLYLNEFLDKIKGTLYRQTMFAEFEMKIHDKYQAGIPLTEEEFSNTYYELNKLYFGPNMISDEEIRYEWERIPHFYTSFYVYKYATGISAAIAFASDILNHVDGAVDRYLTFLKSGGSNYPLEILKNCGVDMTSEEPIQKALDMFEQKLQELKKLI
jgi:oligoendopeptidase F